MYNYGIDIQFMNQLLERLHSNGLHYKNYVKLHISKIGYYNNRRRFEHLYYSFIDRSKIIL